MNIAQRTISLEQPPYIIAELGVNHDGSIERAVELTDAAHRAGADAIKLQLFKADQLLSKASRLAAYQKSSGAADPFELLRRLEIDIEHMQTIAEHAHRLGLHAIVTTFSLEMVSIANEVDWDAFKTASPDIINRPLIERLMALGKPLILSTGAATLDEVARAIGWVGEYPHLLMQCVSAYPPHDENAALGGRVALLDISPHALGYSDHTTSTDTGALAVASGACLLEKHLTYDRNAEGPDHDASLDPEGLSEYVRLAHRAWIMRGPCLKSVLDVEQDVRNVSRQSLTVTGDLPAGHTLKRENLTVKRPGTGLAPYELDDVIGRTLRTAIEADRPLTAGHLE